MTDPEQVRMTSLEQRLAQEPQSPLFARLADYYLQAGRANDALRLCDDGLALYPFYTTAHLIKAKVLNHLGMKAEARHAYEVVQEFLPTNESVERILSTIEPVPSEQAAATIAVPEHFEAEEPPRPDSEVVAEEPQVEETTQSFVEEAPAEEVQAAAVENFPAEEIVALEEPSAALEEPLVQEPITEEPQSFQSAEPAQAPENAFGFGEEPAAEPTQASEDAFGIGTQPAVEPQPEEPSAADKLGLELQPESQQSYDDFMSSLGQPPAAPAEESPFGSEQIEVPQTSNEPEPEAAAHQEIPGDEPPVVAEVPVSAPETPVIEASEWEDAFSQLRQPASETGETTEAPQVAEENPFAVFGTEQPSEAAESEPYEDFTARVRMELFGTEDSVTLEEYLTPAGPAGTPEAAPDQIGELAEKLKSSPRMTPPVINFSEKEARSAGGPEAAGGSGFVTPTLAEIYVKQGWFDDAIKAYRALAANKPAEKEKFEQRIAEIETMKKSSK